MLTALPHAALTHLLPCSTSARVAGAAQLKALRHTVLGGQDARYATLFKGAEGARWLITRPGFTREVLASSAAVVQDETGIRPSAFLESGVAMLGVKEPAAEPAASRNGRAWVVRTFGNQSAATYAYRCTGVSVDGVMIRPEEGLRSGVSREESEAMLAELEATFQGGSRDLPFGFGYGFAPSFCSTKTDLIKLFRKEPLPTGLMLSAWRAEFYWSAGTQWRAEFDRRGGSS